MLDATFFNTCRFVAFDSCNLKKNELSLVKIVESAPPHLSEQK